MIIQSTLWNCAFLDPTRFDKFLTISRRNTARNVERQNSGNKRKIQVSRARSAAAGAVKAAAGQQSVTSSSSSRTSSQCSSTSARVVAPRKVRRTASQPSGRQHATRRGTLAPRLESGANAAAAAAAGPAAPTAAAEVERAAAGAPQTQLLALAGMPRQYGLAGELCATGALRQVERSGSASDMETEVGDVGAAEELEEGAEGDESGGDADSDESGSHDESESQYPDGDENEIAVFSDQMPNLSILRPNAAQLEQLRLLPRPFQKQQSQLHRTGSCLSKYFSTLYIIEI